MSTAELSLTTERSPAAATTRTDGTKLWLPWVTATAVGLIAGGAIALAVLNQFGIRQALGDFYVATMAAAVSFGVVGVVIAAKRPGLAMGRLCCAVAVATVILPAAAQFARFALLTHPGALVAGRPVA